MKKINDFKSVMTPDVIDPNQTVKVPSYANNEVIVNRRAKWKHDESKARNRKRNK